MLQSGLDEKRWEDSMERFCYLRNVQVLLSDGRTPHERRFGEPFREPAIPFRIDDRVSSDLCQRPARTQYS